MIVPFYLSAAVALVSTVLAITRPVAVHGLLWLIVSFIAVACVFFILAAPFAAMLEVMVYAGAIAVLFVFAVMMLNLGTKASAKELEGMHPIQWVLPGLVSTALFAMVNVAIWRANAPVVGDKQLTPSAVALSLYGPYALAVELSTGMLLAGLIGAFHLGRRRAQENA
jgi:NADH-quinone oxidoreductase subunit J